jgi:hypothetical protein
LLLLHRDCLKQMSVSGSFFVEGHVITILFTNVSGSVKVGVNC